MATFGHLQPVSNREDWEQAFTVIDTDTKQPIDITTASITMAVKTQNGKAVLSASVGDGITLTNPTNGVFQWLFDSDALKTICPGEYKVGIVFEINGSKKQLLAGNVEFYDGIVG